MASWRTIDHTNLTNIGTNTHAVIDSYLGSLVSNTVEYYVDSKYIGSVTSNGSINFPFTTISQALALITVPVDNTDPYLNSRFIINVAGGQYNENLNINIGGGRRVTLLAHGLVVIGASTIQYYEGCDVAEA